MIAVNLVTSKAAAAFSTLPIGLEAALLNKCSSLAHALGVTKLKIVKDIILVTLCWAN
jgi:hypothetical protein